MNTRLLAGLLLLAPATALPGARFSHERHLDFVPGDRCTVCHELPAAGPPGAILRSFCAECHGDEIPAYRPPAPLAPRKAAPLSAPFAHEKHVSGRVDCRSCHVPVFPKEGRDFALAQDCTGCHARLGVLQSDCRRCHGLDAQKWRPADHAGAWRRTGHPVEARIAEGTHGRDCRTCHGTDACARCHRLALPQDHTSLFRIRLHGTAASWERERCQACHETGTCVRCHQSTPPPNHSGSWRSVHMLAAGTVGNEHCAVCHRPSFCVGCHTRGP